jgi:glutaredoxin-related protein
MLNLKMFLKYRDNYEVFNEIKEAGKVGLPCIVVNDGEQIIFDYNELEI